MNSHSRRNHFITAIACAALLAGCGGSDSPAAEPADRYAGTWVSDCGDAHLATTAHPDQGLQAVYRLELVKVNADTLRFTVRQEVYPAASGCTGTPLASHTNAADGNTYLIGGQATVDGVAVDRLTVNMAALGGEAPASGGIAYPADFFLSSVDNDKDIVSVTATGMRFGTGTAVDADGYPVALEAGVSLRKA